MNYKYTLDPTDTVTRAGRTLYRIRAKRYLQGVTLGELGGYIESEYNLSTTGDAWVFDNSCVYERAQVRDSARIRGSSEVCGDAVVAGFSSVRRRAHVTGKAWIFNKVVKGPEAFA